ncbi:MAG: hypothetical protein U9N41_04980 [Euryarchaeota archaeon]|nr:hypothetical protein [Euryarchaeota archaeon]
MKMAAKVRVEVVNEEGMKTSMEREGDFMDESFKPSIISSMVKFLENTLPSPFLSDPSEVDSEDLTIKERLAYFLRYDKRSPEDWFTSSQIRRIYEEAYGEQVGISTLSTYLANMHSEGILVRKGSRAKREYRLAKSRITSRSEPGSRSGADATANVNSNDMELIECLPLHELIPR